MNDDDEEDEGWFGGFGFNFEHHVDFDTSEQSVCHELQTFDNLEDAMTRIGRAGSSDLCRDYRQRTGLIEAHMGSMAQCRGKQGETLRQAGAIQAVLNTLAELQTILPSPSASSNDTSESEIIMKLAIACCGAARDLACGSAANRTDLRETETNGIRGMRLLTIYLERYDMIKWDELDSLHLKLLTALIGALRNVTHSTTENCLELHDLGATRMLIWRLKHGSSGDETVALPDSTKPWREGAFRSASTLINMAEKCPASAATCGSDTELIQLVIESWGGTNKHLPLIHLGLTAILRSAQEQLPGGLFQDQWTDILDNEAVRKRMAQAREEERKCTSKNTTAD